MSRTRNAGTIAAPFVSAAARDIASGLTDESGEEVDDAYADTPNKRRARKQQEGATDSRLTAKEEREEERESGRARARARCMELTNTVIRIHG